MLSSVVNFQAFECSGEYCSLQDLAAFACAQRLARDIAMKIMNQRWQWSCCETSIQIPVACISLHDKIQHVCKPYFRVLGCHPHVVKDLKGNYFLFFDHIYSFDLDMKAGTHQLSFRTSQALGNGALHIGACPSSWFNPKLFYPGPGPHYLEPFDSGSKYPEPCAPNWFRELLVNLRMTLVPQVGNEQSAISSLCSAFRASSHGVSRAAEFPVDLESVVSRKLMRPEIDAPTTDLPSNAYDYGILKALAEVTRQTLLVIDAITGKYLVVDGQEASRPYIWNNIFVARTRVGKFSGLEHGEARLESAVQSAETFDVLECDLDVKLDMTLDVSAREITVVDREGRYQRGTLDISAFEPPYRWFAYLAEPSTFTYGKCDLRCSPPVSLQYEV